MAMTGKAGDIFTDINVTPLTDVFLVLLVIMILIAPLVNQTVLKVEPPASNATQQRQAEKGPVLNVEVSAQNTIRINGQLVNPPNGLTVAKVLKEEQEKAGKQDIPLNLTSDANALQKYVVYVMDAAAGCGIKQMRVLPIRNH
jgi:biopolymer transport protein ExbD/biopolymer transport protein TolR